MINVKETIKFSIIVPCYNIEQYIDECVTSVLNQTYSNWELLLINDASEDNTLSRIKKISLSDDRIKVFDKEHKGVSHTRNYGLRYVTGDYLMLLDGDDFFSTDHLEKTFQILNGNDCDMLIYNHQTLFTRESTNPLILFNEYKGSSDNINKIKHIFKREYFLPGATFLTSYSVPFIKSNKILYNEEYAWSEDLDFFMQAISKKPCVNFAYHEFYFYRLDNANSATKNVTAQKLLNTIDVYKKWYDFFEKNKSLYDYSESIQIKIANDLLAQVRVAKTLKKEKKQVVKYLHDNKYIFKSNGIMGSFFYVYYCEDYLNKIIELKNRLKNIIVGKEKYYE